MKRFMFLLLAAGVCFSAKAIEFGTVETATILYDTPSVKGTKLFVVQTGTPVEIVVSIDGWYKVRDPEGALSWIEKKSLSQKRSVIVTAERAQIRQKAEDGAPLVFEAEKNVSLEYLETVPGGWAKVRHRDGQSGFVRPNQVWGL